MTTRVWAAGLVVVVAAVACGSDDRADTSTSDATEATDAWSFTLELTVDKHAAAGREGVDLTVEIIRKIGEAPEIAHQAPLRVGSTEIAMDLADAVGIDLRLGDTLALPIDRPFWNPIYDGRIRVHLARGGFTLIRRIPEAGCWGDRSACRQRSERIQIPMPADMLEEMRTVPVRIRPTQRLTDLIGEAELIVRSVPPEGGDERVILQQVIDEPRRVEEVLALERNSSLQVSIGNGHAIVIPPEVWTTTWDRVTVVIDDDQIRVITRVVVGQRLQRREERFPVGPPPGSGI